MEWQNKSKLLLGEKALEYLKNRRVAVFGLGGVGGGAAEALVRAGIGNIDFIDSDTFCQSNKNRQLLALESTMGRKKTDAAADRARDINPDINIKTYDLFYLPETAGVFDFGNYDYVIDAIDTVTAKLDLAEKCIKMNIPIISAMGAGNKLCAELFEVTDIYATSVCPLAKIMRSECRKRRIDSLKVVFSKEKPIETNSRTPGSVSWVPPVMGYIMAGEVIKDLLTKGK